jgi:hypothetical protein
MYASSLMFHTLPGKTGELESELHKLLKLVDLETLEKQIHRVTSDTAFQTWTKKVSPLLRQTPNREIFLVVADGAQQAGAAAK